MNFALVLSQNKKLKHDNLLFNTAAELQELAENQKKLFDYCSKIDSLKNNNSKINMVIVLNESIKKYKELIKKYPNSHHFFNALNNMALAELSLGKEYEALLTFKRILTSEVNEIDNLGLGSEKLFEPYTNYKNRAALNIALLHLKWKNYKLAIDYLDLTKNYPFQHFCGNAHEAIKLYKIELYAKAYIGLNDKNSALNILLPELFNDALADNEEIVRLTFELLSEKYSKEQLKTMFEESFKEIKNDSTVNIVFICFLSKRIYFPFWNLDVKSLNKEQEIKEYLSKSYLYKLFNS